MRKYHEEKFFVLLNPVARWDSQRELSSGSSLSSTLDLEFKTIGT
jgi:hypothetical protein